MSCSTNIVFKGIDHISEELLLNILESNFKMFLDWGFLNIGAWFDATISNSGSIYGSSYPHSKLMMVEDPSYEDGQVWQSIRKDWVWESGACYSSGNPISISGVYVDTVYNPYSSGDFIINYPMGRIIFDDAISSTSDVKLNYSYRYVQTYRANDAPWLSSVQYWSFRNNNPDIGQISDGEWAVDGNHRVQLPAIVIESIPRSRSRPYELGNSLLWIEQDIGFYVFAENKNDRNKILDILRLQQDATIQLFDTNKLAQDDNYPLDHNGQLKNNSLMYNNIVSQYPWKKCLIKNISLIELDSLSTNLHQGLARATIEIISG
jgi:hypothetical protein